MTKKQSARLSYALVLSIVLVMTGFLGLGIRAFASAAVSDFIYFVTLGVFLAGLTIYFVLRRPVAAKALDRKSQQLSSIRSGEVTLHVRKDRRRALVQGQEWAAVEHERRSTQLDGFRVVGLELNASKTLRA